MSALPAFIPAPDDEDHVMDTLGFSVWGAYEGAWSGTSTWLSDAPLPDDVPKGMRRRLPENLPFLERAADAVGEGRTRPAVLLAPEVEDGITSLPIQGEAFSVDPNYVAHIVRTIDPDRSGGWQLTELVQQFGQGLPSMAPLLVYVIDGNLRAVVAPKRSKEQAA